MKNKRIKGAILFIALFVQVSLYGQNFTISNYIYGSGNIRVKETEKVSDGYIILDNS